MNTSLEMTGKCKLPPNVFYTYLYYSLTIIIKIEIINKNQNYIFRKRPFRKMSKMSQIQFQL